MRAFLLLGATVISSLGRLAIAHPLCYYDDKPTDPDMDLQFCPEQEDGACCNDLEEAAAIAVYNAAASDALTGDCATYYRQVACGPCNSYAAHLYERLGGELGPEDGMTMKEEFCSELVAACSDQIDFPTYNGDSYCEKHVGDDGQIWSYPIDPAETTFSSTGLVKAFETLDDSELPSELLSMHMTPDGDEWWLGGQDGQIVSVPAEEPTSSTLIVDISSGMGLYKAYEEGLIDFAFNPAFNDNNYFYISYTIQDDEGTKNRLARFTYSSSSDAVKASVDILITTIAKSTSIHSAGWCGFKPSDYNNPNDATHDLYWSVGDGGPQLDTDNRGPDLTNLLASIIRISVPSSSSATGYTIPSGNRAGEICANGFRNPFRCAFDLETDDLYCGDVGHTMVEEIDLIQCNKDYGWSQFEGSRCQEAVEDRYGDCASADRSDFVFPEFEYCHPGYYSTLDTEDEFTNGVDICGSRAVVGNAVIGGHVYRGQRFSEVLNGAIIFADAQKANIYYLIKEDGEWVAGTIISDNSASVVSFSEDNSGEQYVIGGDRIPYQLPCGDLCAQTCLDQSDELPTYESLGCYNDVVNDRTLSLQESPDCPDGQSSMSPALCASYCDTIEGATYFGVEYAYECYCGAADQDYTRHGELPMESCETICTGTPDEFCGGHSAIEVYSFESAVPTPVPPTPVPPVPATPAPGSSSGHSPAESDDYTYVGCYADSSPRTFTGPSTSSSSMTADACATFCDGSTYFATEYGVECFCSSTDDDYTSSSTASCTMACSGDSTETCGGAYAMTIYEYGGGSGPSPTPSGSDDYDFVGCFGDSSDRALSGSSTSSSSMTPEVCAEYCEGSQYFGTEFSTECFCSSTGDDYDTYGDANCDYLCGGDNSEVCGGYYAISIYEFTSSTSTPDYSYVGCYEDSKTDRVLSTKIGTGSMTNEVCASSCEGSTYFGTQYGTECWCGSPSSLGSTASNCDMDCSGDSSQTCGGYDALSIHAYDDASGPSPTPSSNYIGCFADSKTDRVMDSKTTSESMTTELCASNCAGFSYYGTQFGSECWCTDSDTYTNIGEATNCNFACSGDSSQTCGGYDALSVYGQ